MNDDQKEIIKRRLAYNPETGVISWKDKSRKVAPGQVAGGVDVHGYIQIAICGRVLKGHRIAWLLVTGDWPKEDIDHINGVRSDNRWGNLRAVTNAINCQNKRAPLPSNKSGFLGVSWNRGAWRATIQIDGKQKSLGRFSDPRIAHEAYLSAKRELHVGCTI